MGIKHSFTSSKAVGADATKVRANDWNDDHEITGDVDFDGNAINNIADDAYNATSWDGDLSVPTKNALRDKIEALVLGSGSGTLITPRSSTLTIASGAITVTASFHYVDTEGGAATDNLDTINGGTDGQRITLAAANPARRVFLRSSYLSGGNISCGNGGFDLVFGGYIGFYDGDNINTIDLIFDANQNIWLEQSRGGRISTHKNVRDYGATGDGVTDDTAAIQAAIDDDNNAPGRYTNLRTGTIYFPVGNYKLTTPITWLGNAMIRFLGEAGATIEGSFNGYLFEGSGGYNYSHHSFENLSLSNSNATATTSGCIKVSGVISCLVKNCLLGVNGGVAVNQDSSQDVTIDTCTIIGGGATSTSIGFMAGNASASIDSDYVGLGDAIRHNNIGLNVIGGRMEVNGTGITIGKGIDGSNLSSAAVFVSGMSLESNNTHIHFSNGGGVVQGCYISSFNPGNNYGILASGANNVCIDGCAITGLGYAVAGIQLNTDANNSVNNCTVRNTTSTSWVVAAEIDTTSWVGTNYTPAFTNRYNERGDDGGLPPSPTIDPVTATIASGVITVAANYMVIDTEGSAATDDLDTLSGVQHGSHGSRLVLRAASSARTVVVKDGTNLKLAGGDFSLDNEEDTIELIYDCALGKWLELSRSDNGA